MIPRIGEGLAKIFGGASGAAGTAAGVGTSAAGSIGTAASGAAGAAGSAGSAASSGAGAASSSLLGTVSSVTGIVTGIVSAGAGVYGDAVLTNIKDCLNEMRNDTKYLSWNFDGGGLHAAILDLQNNVGNFVGAFVDGITTRSRV